MATVEAAIALGALVLVFAVVLAGLGAVVARIRCVDAAGEAARRAARDDDTAARAVAVGLPAGTDVAVVVEGDTVRVRVAIPPLGGALRGLRVSAEAVAAREPSLAGPTGAPDGAPGTDGPAADLVGPPDPADPAGPVDPVDPPDPVDPAGPVDPVGPSADDPVPEAEDLPP